MRFIKIVGNTAVYAHKNSIIRVDIDAGAKQVLDYYHKIPANL